MDKRSKKNEKASKRSRYDLDKLLEQITPDNQPESFDDPPVGEEKP